MYPYYIFSFEKKKLLQYIMTSSKIEVENKPLVKTQSAFAQTVVPL